MKKMHNICIDELLEAGEISDSQAAAPSSEEAGVLGGGAGAGPAVDTSDPDLKDDSANGNWKGNVKWMKLH